MFSLQPPRHISTLPTAHQAAPFVGCGRNVGSLEAEAMKIPRREFWHLATGIAALPVVSRIARAQTYPTRPVRIIVPFPAGGTADILARLTGQWLLERLGQQFIIENRPGAGANIGTEVAVRAPPDGYTLLVLGQRTLSMRHCMRG
jgi:hypothetical protein